MITLNVEKRDTAHKLATLRASGKIPAVFYGRKEPSTSISISKIDFLKAWKEAGESSVITLKGDSDDHEALIHDVDLDPVSGVVRHVDFYILEKGKKVKVHVPLEFIGVAPAVKDLGGSLVKVLHEIEVEAFPKDLPHSLNVDISTLATFESQVLAKEIALPAGVELMTQADEVIALTNAPREEKEEEVVPVDLAAIEVTDQKGKKEEEVPAAE
ncbi:MAG: 50S ribosomal protein L25 [Candidatus Pacebacteria bacterium]|nr:50S ribosomal protein L25 [Candidatus Paceibacterota bacterium]